MKIQSMAILMMVAAGSNAAEWSPLGSTDGRGGTDIYVDRASLSKSGNAVQLWMMEDHKVAQTFSGKTFLSARLQHEYDCRENQRRVLQSALHAGRKGTGDVVYTSAKPGPWRPISAGTVAETMWKMACERKPGGKP